MAAYMRCASLAGALAAAGGLGAKTLVLDVEPLIAPWDTGLAALDEGIARVLPEAASVPGVQVVCFSTNSRRRPSAPPAGADVAASYLASAGKPLRTAPYRGFPSPGVVIGDQVITDGVLALRLGYTFLHCQPALGAIPRGPRLFARLGSLLRPLLFRHPAR